MAVPPSLGLARLLDGGLAEPTEEDLGQLSASFMRWLAPSAESASPFNSWWSNLLAVATAPPMASALASSDRSVPVRLTCRSLGMLSALLGSGAPGVWTCQAATAEEAGEGRHAAATAAAAAVTAAAAEEAAAAADALSEVVKPWLFSPQWRCRAAATRSLVTLRQAAHDWASFVNEEAGGISRPFLWPASSSTGVVIGLLVGASTDEHAPVRQEAVLGLGAVFAMTRTWEVRAASVVRLPSSPLSLTYRSLTPCFVVCDTLIGGAPPPSHVYGSRCLHVRSLPSPVPRLFSSISLPSW